MNNIGGKATYKGINSQSWAALSLFLQYVRFNLNYIAFEQDRLKDFDLVFTDQKKIICESKTEKITHSVIREILDKLVDNDKVGDKDEILIICQDISPVAQSDIENLKYYNHLKKKLKGKKFTEKHLELVPKVKFWKVDKSINQLIVNSLLSEVLGAWVPDQTFQEIVNDIIIEKVYKGSESGGILTKKDFYQMLDDRKKQIQRNAGYEDEQNQKLEQIDRVLSSINNPTSRSWCNDQISLLTTTPDLYYLTIKKLESFPSLKLSQWDNLWKAATKGVFSLQVFNIFKKNLNDPNNQEYLINFIPTFADKLLSFYRQEFIVVDIAKMCSSIMDQTRTYDDEVVEILKSLLEASIKDQLYVKGWKDRKEWEQKEISEILKAFYQKTNDTVKFKIVDFILSFFDLVGDDGQFWHYTPNAIIEILKIYVEGNIETRILSLSEIFSEQYENFYRRFGRKSIYDGWEHIGFTNTDRHFLTYILQPVISEYYDSKPDQAWNFIRKKLVTKKGSLVSKDHPDFLNRAAIPALLKGYQNQEHKDEALGILKDFVEMRKGIPHKTEVIYKQILGSSMSSEHKWELVNLQLSFEPYKGLPANHYVEKIISELASNGHLEAIGILETWAISPEYNKFRGIHESNITTNVPGLIANPQTRARGIGLLKKFLASEFFIDNQGLWDVWETAKVLTTLLIEEFEEGKSIIESIWSCESLSNNQQVLITNSINGLDKNDILIIQAYREILSKWLDDCNDNINEVIKKIPDIQSRTSIVQFGEKLANARDYDGAIRIAKIFINDPDPVLENASDDPEGKHNHHEQIKKGEGVLHITTVRVWVAELLQNFAVLSARDYIPKILPLVQKLTVDSNFYVRTFSCFPLEHLAQQRHTVLPSDGKTRFMGIKVAEDIEKIAYSMLRNKENLKLKQVMRGLLRVFSNFRMVTEVEAKGILQTILNTEDSIVIEEARSLFIFFAEFRATAISKRNEHVFSEERVKKLSKFEDTYFKKMLIKILKESPGEIKGGFAWAFWQLPKEPGVDFEKCFSLSYKYLSVLVEQYEHEVMTDVYYFIEEYIDEKFEECFDLWKKCLMVEKPYLTKSITKDNLYDMHWLSYHYNGKILVKIGQKKGGQEFLAWLDFLLGYPEGVLIANDLSLAVDYLMTLPINDHSQSIFKKVAARNNEHFEKMKEWLKNETF